MQSLKFNKSFYRSLKSQIDYCIFHHGLDSFDFEVEFENEQDDEIFIEIWHKKYEEQIKFIGYTEDCTSANLVLSPFEHINQHSILTQISEIKEHIKSWFEFAMSEISALDEEHRGAKAKAISDTIAPVLESFVHTPDNYFTTREVEDIKVRLDTLECYFKEIQESLGLNQEAISSLAELIEKIKDSAETEKQQKWYDRTLHHMSEWAGRMDKIEKFSNALSKGSDLIDKLPL